MDLNIPNNIDSSGFVGNGYPNLQPLPNINSNATTNYPTTQFPSPPLDFQTEFKTPGLKININITQYQHQQQNFLNNPVMFPNATEASASFSYAQCIGNLAQQFISSPQSETFRTFNFEFSEFKIKITIEPTSTPMFQQEQQYNYPQQQNQ
ncbi:hypothetical protein RhiirA5_378158 [Rhizophagus irregularis]|uniref:Uncharacterized protein n=1 Tax=Rhizophagus irregularis TaxID=588596 RepID=A0A2I1F172_9GLOM|nr:hypothetical protein RhiirA5_378158 [Rhizophagus irregularis]PKY28103.1 hypothetical protein RhiirB3_444108 [Rhizophagus irregularis]CAB5201439.1 unnamed protein product [Rhizophagus irregularis]CAB5374770.1 unnamed protein product [Rhizophagus irregularis]